MSWYEHGNREPKKGFRTRDVLNIIAAPFVCMGILFLRFVELCLVVLPYAMVIAVGILIYNQYFV